MTHKEICELVHKLEAATLRHLVIVHCDDSAIVAAYAEQLKEYGL